MQIRVDENGYCVGYTTGEFEYGIDWTGSVPEHFYERSGSYKVVNGELVFDAAKEEADDLDTKVDEIRARREIECFEVVNRGGLWYDLLKDDEKLELLDWYQAWLDATETLVIPEKPEWL